MTLTSQPRKGFNPSGFFVNPEAMPQGPLEQARQEWLHHLAMGGLRLDGLSEGVRLDPAAAHVALVEERCVSRRLWAGTGSPLLAMPECSRVGRDPVDSLTSGLLSAAVRNKPVLLVSYEGDGTDLVVCLILPMLPTEPYQNDLLWVGYGQLGLERQRPSVDWTPRGRC